MKDSSGDKRKIYLDILRIIAIFLVIFNHTGTQGFFLFSVTPVTVEYWVYLSMSIFCKIAVPLFFMISGALLIGKDDTFRILRWRISRFILVILGASFFWYVILVRNHIEPFSIYSFFRRVYSNDVIVPYWFLYSYLSILLMLPLIRKMAQNMKEKDYIYLITMYIIFSMLIPVFQYFAFNNTVNISIEIPIITYMPIFYLCIGYYLDHYFDEARIKKHREILWIVGLLSIVVACFMVHYNCINTGICNEKSSQLFHSTFILMPAIGVFCGVKYAAGQTNFSICQRKWILSLSQCVFGIFVMEQYLRDKIFPIGTKIFYFLPPIIICCVNIILVIIVGFMLTSILRKIPIIRKVI